MKLHREIRVQKLQTKNRMVGKTFSILDENVMRWSPWMGRSFYENNNQEQRNEFYKNWENDRINELRNGTKIILASTTRDKEEIEERLKKEKINFSRVKKYDEFYYKKQ